MNIESNNLSPSAKTNTNYLEDADSLLRFPAPFSCNLEDLKKVFTQVRPLSFVHEETLSEKIRAVRDMHLNLREEQSKENFEKFTNAATSLHLYLAKFKKRAVKNPYEKLKQHLETTSDVWGLDPGILDLYFNNLRKALPLSDSAIRDQLAVIKGYIQDFIYALYQEFAEPKTQEINDAKSCLKDYHKKMEMLDEDAATRRKIPQWALAPSLDSEDVQNEFIIIYLVEISNRISTDEIASLLYFQRQLEQKSLEKGSFIETSDIENIYKKNPPAFSQKIAIEVFERMLQYRANAKDLEAEIRKTQNAIHEMEDRVEEAHRLFQRQRTRSKTHSTKYLELRFFLNAISEKIALYENKFRDEP